jgi:GNAT superfamily N-acetyltransferase
MHRTGAGAFTIRRAGPEDMPALIGLFRGFMADQRVPSPPDADLAAAIMPVFSDPHAEVLIAEDGDGTPLAYTHLRYYYSVWTAAPECFIEDLFVVESHRDRGVGRRVLAAVFERARARGCHRARLDTNEQNHRGVHLYESLGFACTRDSYDGGRQLYYTKNLHEGSEG